jgi:hypothetical protein
MKPSTRKLLIIITVILTVIVAVTAGLIWVVVCGWPPIIIRDRAYYKLLADFKQAQGRDKLRRDGEYVGWGFQVHWPENPTGVQVESASHAGVVSVKYSDEAQARPLYKYVDYTNTLEIKTSANILYVHWGEIMFGSRDWLMAYDLAARREILSRKIDSEDLR